MTTSTARLMEEAADELRKIYGLLRRRDAHPEFMSDHPNISAERLRTSASRIERVERAIGEANAWTFRSDDNSADSAFNHLMAILTAFYGGDRPAERMSDVMDGARQEAERKYPAARPGWLSGEDKGNGGAG